MVSPGAKSAVFDCILFLTDDFTTESQDERILKIVRHFAKLWTRLVQ